MRRSIKSVGTVILPAFIPVLFGFYTVMERPAVPPAKVVAEVYAPVAPVLLQMELGQLLNFLNPWTLPSILPIICILQTMEIVKFVKLLHLV